MSIEKPEIGETRLGRMIGKLKSPSNLYRWSACEKCGKERWVRVVKNKTFIKLCSSCHGKTLHTPEVNQKISDSLKNKALTGDKHPHWKGGRNKDKSGYINVYIAPDDFYFSMANKSTHKIREHRLVMAKYLNRCLLPWEVVHHINGIRDDNRIDNLQLLPTSRFHVADSLLKSYANKLERQNELLKKSVHDLVSTKRFLQSQLDVKLDTTFEQEYKQYLRGEI